jgi:hypothetical protein
MTRDIDREYDMLLIRERDFIIRQRKYNRIALIVGGSLLAVIVLCAFGLGICFHILKIGGV